MSTTFEDVKNNITPALASEALLVEESSSSGIAACWMIPGRGTRLGCGVISGQGA